MRDLSGEVELALGSSTKKEKAREISLPGQPQIPVVHLLDFDNDHQEGE